MEIEQFFSGYCRQTDCSRMVAIVMEAGTLMEADCSYPSCPYAPACPIAGKIEEALR